MAGSRTRVVVIGAGYAGLLFTTRLAAKAPWGAQITLVSESATSTERLRLHQFATNQAIHWRPIAQTLRGRGVEFVQGSVMRIEAGRREIGVAQEGQPTRQIAYDYLIYALGSLTDRQRVPGVAEYAYTLAPSGPLSAAALRERLPELAAQSGRVVVVGGGATGIETAAELATAYPRLHVQLVADGALGRFWGKGVAAYIRKSLTRQGVAISDETHVAAVQADGVTADTGAVIPCDLCLWAGGFVAPPLAREAGLTVNERDQVVIDPYMRALGHHEIYAVGDAATPHEAPGVPAVRMSAATATILGAHGADCLAKVLRGRQPKPLSFAYLGQGIALGRGNAIGFNNYPNDRPRRPYFTGQLAYQVREVFVRYLASAPRLERRRLGFFWPGKGRYAAAQRRLAAMLRVERAEAR